MMTHSPLELISESSAMKFHKASKLWNSILVNYKFTSKSNLTNFFAFLGGAKQYALKFKLADGSFRYLLKIRGQTLNYNSLRTIATRDDLEEDQDQPRPELPDEELQARAYNNFKEMILAFGNITNDQDFDPLLFNYNNLRPQRFGGVHTVQNFKRYRPIIINSIITNNYNIIPFGYMGPI
jgi:hypothetical protein